jgi:hypothetical protein
MSKLTLSISPSVIARAKRYANKHGTSVSKMVEAYLASVAVTVDSEQDPPVLRSLRGILRKGGMREYRKHLTEKYL